MSLLRPPCVEDLDDDEAGLPPDPGTDECWEEGAARTHKKRRKVLEMKGSKARSRKAPALASPGAAAAASAATWDQPVPALDSAGDSAKVLAARAADSDSDTAGVISDPEAPAAESPMTFHQVSDFLPGLYQRMVRKSPGLAAAFKQRLTEGVVLTTSYSGVGCPETAADLLVQDPALRNLPGSKIFCYSAWEIEPSAVFMLLGRKGQSPHHVFGDLKDRMKPSILERLNDICSEVLARAAEEDEEMPLSSRSISRQTRKTDLGLQLLNDIRAELRCSDRLSGFRTRFFQAKRTIDGVFETSVAHQNTARFATCRRRSVCTCQAECCGLAEVTTTGPCGATWPSAIDASGTATSTQRSTRSATRTSASGTWRSLASSASRGLARTAPPDPSMASGSTSQRC